MKPTSLCLSEYGDPDRGCSSPRKGSRRNLERLTRTCAHRHIVVPARSRRLSATPVRLQRGRGALVSGGSLPRGCATVKAALTGERSCRILVLQFRRRTVCHIVFLESGLSCRRRRCSLCRHKGLAIHTCLIALTFR